MHCLKIDGNMRLIEFKCWQQISLTGWKMIVEWQNAASIGDKLLAGRKAAIQEI